MKNYTVIFKSVNGSSSALVQEYRAQSIESLRRRLMRESKDYYYLLATVIGQKRNLFERAWGGGYLWYADGKEPRFIGNINPDGTLRRF